MTAIAARDTLPPLCVDLDGTLIRSNLLLESILHLVGRNPLFLFMLPVWLWRGRATLKAEVAARVELNPAALPYDLALLNWLRAERARGRELWLCTSANERLAAPVASHLGVFAGLVASDPGHDLAGRAKAQRLIDLFGDGGFEYCGNAHRDLAVWQHARVVPQLAQFAPRRSRWRAVARALRPHQWAKNILLLVPLLTSHRLGNLASLRMTLLAVLVFSLCASAVYVLNDLLDLEADRHHPRKASRPFAAGDASIGAGLLLIPALLAAAALLAMLLPVTFRLVLTAYFALTLAYSLDLKRRVLIDAMALAGLYTLRIIAGAAATSIALSFWLLLFSVFLFLSLAFAKRYAELDELRRQHRLRAAGRGYQTDDLPILRSMGTASGYLCVLVLALYINSPEVGALYHRPKVIWLLCVVMLYWVSRLWVVAQRGKLHDDPVIYALTDRVSLLTGVLAACIIAAAM
jgi:4-hydroxybenzoate polyprenyltransferase